AVLADTRVSSLPSLGRAADAEAELRRLLDVRVIPNSYLLSVSMRSQSPVECETIVNAVVQAYLSASAEWSYGLARAQIKSLEDYQRELAAQVSERQEALLRIAARPNDPGVRSDVRGRVNTERMNRLLADYDAAVTARIKTEAALEA